MVSENANERSEQLRIALLDNALDSLLSAAEAVHRDEGPRSLKEAVLHLANGVELVIKARIAQEHWSLIFSNIDQASYGKIVSGDFVSVGYGKAIERLEGIVDITVERQSKHHLQDLRKHRNLLTHFTGELDAAQTKSLLAKGMAFCVLFCEQQNMTTPAAESKIGDIHVNLAGLQEFVNDRMESIFTTAQYTLIWECPKCWQEALTIDGGVVQCQFCRRDADPHELATFNSEGDIEDCPECDTEQTFAFVLLNNEKGMWVCFSCGEHGEHYDRCLRCDQPEDFRDSDGVNICDRCWEHIMERG